MTRLSYFPAAASAVAVEWVILGEGRSRIALTRADAHSAQKESVVILGEYLPVTGLDGTAIISVSLGPTGQLQAQLKIVFRLTMTGDAC